MIEEGETVEIEGLGPCSVESVLYVLRTPGGQTVRVPDWQLDSTEVDNDGE